MSRFFLVTRSLLTLFLVLLSGSLIAADEPELVVRSFHIPDPFMNLYELAPQVQAELLPEGPFDTNSPNDRLISSPTAWDILKKQAGVALSGGSTVFYGAPTKLLIVRAPIQDLDKIDLWIESMRTSPEALDNMASNLISESRTELLIQKDSSRESEPSEKAALEASRTFVRELEAFRSNLKGSVIPLLKELPPIVPKTPPQRLTPPPRKEEAVSAELQEREFSIPPLFRSIDELCQSEASERQKPPSLDEWLSQMGVPFPEGASNKRISPKKFRAKNTAANLDLIETSLSFCDSIGGSVERLRDGIDTYVERRLETKGLTTQQRDACLALKVTAEKIETHWKETAELLARRP